IIYSFNFYIYRFEEATFDEMDLNYDKIYTLAMINNEETEVSNPLSYSEENIIK
ncbi:merozoite adhesive erythrocytic binding protein, partial [Plasmodium reichenowi]